MNKYLKREVISSFKHFCIFEWHFILNVPYPHLLKLIANMLLFSNIFLINGTQVNSNQFIWLKKRYVEEFEVNITTTISTH